MNKPFSNKDMKNKPRLIIGLALVAGAILFYESGQTMPKAGQTDQSTSKTQGVELVDAATFSQLIKDQDTFLIDVHTPEQTHIPGTDAFVPFDKIAENQHKLPEDKNIPILVYCRSGSMSKQASQEISDLGYTNVYDLDGGIDAYKESVVHVVLNPQVQDLGKVIYGDIPTTSFTLTNFTPTPLKVTRVSTSCGCTSAEVENHELLAYESTMVKVSFNPAVHEDGNDLGEVTRTIYIETDNINYSKLEATITATVIKQENANL